MYRKFHNNQVCDIFFNNIDLNLLCPFEAFLIFFLGGDAYKNLYEILDLWQLNYLKISFSSKCSTFSLYFRIKYKLQFKLESI